MFWKAEVNRLLGVTQVAEDTYKNLKSQTAPVFRNHDNLNPVLLYYILASERLGQQNEAESIIIKAKETLSADAWFHFNLCRYYSMTGKLEQSLSSLSKAVELGWEPNISMIIFGTVKDPMLDPLRNLPEFQAWEKRWSPPYKDYSKE
ncbi:MAG: hypothetical protein IPH31_11210 [Lewinellaceae bacterium]|nr:hypothetical protein [Lewinellaceae bacterium]